MHETGNASIFLTVSWCLSSYFKQYSVDVDQTARLKSVTQEGDMEEFFNTAELAGTDFAAGEFLSDRFIHGLFML